MKRVFNYYLSMMFLASLFLVTSCGDDTEDDPIIGAPSVELEGVDEEVVTVNAGETVAFTVNVTAPAGFNTFIVSQSVDGSDWTRIVTEAKVPGTSPTTFDYDFSFTPTAAMAGQEHAFEFRVVDETNEESAQVFTVNVSEQEIVSYNTVLLLAPTADGTNEVWFSTSTGERYSTADVNNTEDPLSAEIDFGYRYGPNAGATLASPAAYPAEGGQNTTGWEVLNETNLRGVAVDVTEEEFLEMGTSDQELIDAYDAGEVGSDPQRITNLSAGDVLAFVTDDESAGGSRYGLIHVEDIDLGTDGTGYGSDASITLNVRVQGATTATE